MSVVGVVKFYDALKGFGFITRDDGKGDVYVHVSRFRAPLTRLSKGARVEFDVSRSATGWVASDVHVFDVNAVVRAMDEADGICR